MENFKMKCPNCLHEFTGDSQQQNTVCPSCGKELSTNMAIKYYQAIHKIATEKTKIALGEVYAEVNRLLDEIKWLIDNENYLEALELTNKALSLTTTDGRVYMQRVIAKTKNFTDYDEDSHYEDLKKAIELSTTLEKEEIRKTYASYHRKKTLPKEEFNEYENQESSSKLKRIEELLKDSIPAHFQREKFVKASPWIMGALTALLITFVILATTLQNTVFTIIFAVLFVADLIVFSKFVSDNKLCKVFNATLDIYDNLNGFELTPQIKLKTATLLEKLSVSMLNKETPSRIEDCLTQIIELLLNTKNERAIKFLLEHKITLKYIKIAND